MGVKLSQFNKPPVSLLQQSIHEQQDELRKLPEGVKTAVVGKVSTENGGEAHIGIVHRSEDGRWTMKADFGVSKEQGFSGVGSFIWIPK